VTAITLDRDVLHINFYFPGPVQSSRAVMARLTLEAMMSIRGKRQAYWLKKLAPVGYFSLRWLTGQGEARLVGNVGAHFDPIRTSYRKKTPSS
jgi:hypothetical protein